MLRKLGLLAGLGLVVLLMMGAGEYMHLSEKKFVSFALTATGDTALTNRIEVWWYVDDSCSDTVLTIQYPLIWNLRFK